MNEPVNQVQPVLAVDLDGTLLRGDVFGESLVRFLLPAPWRIGTVIRWLVQGGRPWAKARLAERLEFDGAVLPWNEAVVNFCEARAAQGWLVVVATASNEDAARSLTRHFPFVSRVLGSDDRRNLKADEKAKRLCAEFGAAGFEYVGDSKADLVVWTAAARAWFVGTEGRRQAFARVLGKPLETVGVSQRAGLSSLIGALRPHQWLKNLLVFVPLLTAHRWSDVSCWGQLLPVFVALCFMASAAYLVNDLADLDSDRRHPRKKLRPLASGKLSLPIGLAAVFILLAAGAGLAAISGSAALGATVGYFVLSVLYSLLLKTFPVVDVIYLSGLYTYRMVLGGIAGSIMISPWLLAFSTTFFLGLAFLKRYVELDEMPAARTKLMSEGR